MFRRQPDQPTHRWAASARHLARSQSSYRALSDGSVPGRAGVTDLWSARAPVWVGQVEVGGPIASVQVSPTFLAARLLVTAQGVAVGHVLVALLDGRVDGEAIRSVIDARLGSAIADVVDPLPAAVAPITVVIATRNRPDSVARCVRSVLDSDHRCLTVLVVDNDPPDDRTAAVVRAVDDPRVGYVRESRRGTSAGRNRGLREVAARGGRFVGFIDDDVEVDRAWAGRIAAALSGPGVSCVCGPVTAARLDTTAQLRAELGLGWMKGFARRRFSVAEPPADSAVFPFSPGLFGVGANLAVNVEAALAAGGFDPALGPGTRTRGGEDCEFLIRLVLAGHVLGYEPSAYVWHHHRPSDGELDEQLRGYRLGLAGFLTKIVLDPVGRAAAVRRLPAAVVQMWRIRARGSTAPRPDLLRCRRLPAWLVGPLAYLLARRSAWRAGMTTPTLLAAPDRRPARSPVSRRLGPRPAADDASPVGSGPPGPR